MQVFLLSDKNQLILGCDEDGFILSDDSKHIFVSGPSGSGKGVGFVIPNLLFWEGSAVVQDIKRENFDLTSGWREKAGHKVYLWNPACQKGESHGYNPLDGISNHRTRMVDDIQRIAYCILTENEFWSNEARILFIGIVLWLTGKEKKNRTLGQVVKILGLTPNNIV